MPSDRETLSSPAGLAPPGNRGRWMRRTAERSSSLLFWVVQLLFRPLSCEVVVWCIWGWLCRTLWLQPTRRPRVAEWSERGLFWNRTTISLLFKVYQNVFFHSDHKVTSELFHFKSICNESESMGIDECWVKVTYMGWRFCLAEFSSYIVLREK